MYIFPELDELITFNKEIQFRNYHFQISDTEKEQNFIKFDWSAIFLSGYLDSGCHSLQIIGISDNEKILLEDQMNICKNKI